MARLGEAFLRINESLEVETVLQRVLDSARSLIGARYGWMMLHDGSGWFEEYVYSGMTAEQALAFWELSGMVGYHREFVAQGMPWRAADIHTEVEGLDWNERPAPFPLNEKTPMLGVEIKHQGQGIGALYAADIDEQAARMGQVEFSEGDEELMAMFAAQAALVITNARRHRQEQRARADMEALVSSVPVGVLVFDADALELVSANREARRILGGDLAAGSPAAQVLGSAEFRGTDGRQVPAAELLEPGVLDAGDALLVEELTVEAPGGTSVSALASAKPVRPDGDAVASVVVTIQDTSPLAEMERLRTEFVGMVGHELRMPLTSIKGSASALLAGPSKLGAAEMVEFFRIIDEQADYMQDLIADLIDVVRIETGTLSVVPEPVEVPKVVDGARNSFLSAGGRDNVRISVDPGLPPIMAEERRIVQVIANLLANAARNSHDSSPIHLTAEADGVHVAIGVADEGRGLSADRIPHLFTKFYRPPGKDRGQDMGLGLAICKGIVEAHGGRIWAESDGSGLGSRFTFTVPAADPAAPAPADEAAGDPAAAPAGGDRTGVLALDDDPRTLKLVRDTLEDAGYDVVVTGDPDQLLPLIEEAAPQVLVLDMMLPETDGIELMGDVLADSDIPVIFLSGYDRAELVANAFEMGAVDYIVKPFAPTELAARVRAALRKRPDQTDRFVTGGLVIDFADRSVTVGGRPVELAPLEYGLLAELAANAGTALTHEQLLDAVWGPDNTGDAGLVRTVIKSLRKKLGDQIKNPKYIYTVPRTGYRIPKP